MGTLKIEVAYHERLIALQVSAPCMLAAAIQQSGILQVFPDIDLTQQSVGVFSQLRQLTDFLEEGDRVEIYQPLLIDPKEARRARVKKKAKK